MRQIPGRESVGGEALVYQRQGADRALVAQIEVIFADLVGQQHAFVNDGARGQRGDIEVSALFVGQVAHRVFGSFADDEQLALETVGVGTCCSASDEYLAHQRLYRLDALAQAAVVHRYIAPAQQGLAFRRDLGGNDVFAGGTRHRVARQKQDADAVITRCGQGHALRGTGFAQKCVGNLDQYPRPVARQRIGAHCAAMGEVLQKLQTLKDDIVTFLSLDVCYKAHTAGIALMARIIQALLYRQRRMAHVVPQISNHYSQ